MTKRAAKRPSQVVANPEPMGVAVRQRAVTKISPRRPSQWLRGSTMKAPLEACQLRSEEVEVHSGGGSGEEEEEEVVVV
jgi:hypothetical protein